MYSIDIKQRCSFRARKILYIKASWVLIITVILLQLTSVYSFALEKVEQENETEVRNYEKAIAHGGGIYKGYETSNSVEAVNDAIINGYKMIELDMEISKDNKIIMLHDWDRTIEHYLGSKFDDKLREDSFLRLKIFGQLEVLTFDKLTKILDNAPDVRIVTDTKGDNLKLLNIIAESYPDYIDRMVPQIYSFEEYDEVKSLGFKNIILTLYLQENPKADEIIDFAKKNDLYAVTMQSYYAEKGLCKEISNNGIKVYVHPINDIEYADKLFDMGAAGIYTSTILPQELDGIERDYYLTIEGEDGKQKKLLDSYIDDFQKLQIHGLKEGESAKFFLGDRQIQLDKSAFNDIQETENIFTVKIYEKNQGFIGNIDYILSLDGENIRILHKKYEYRLETVKKPNDLKEVMDNLSISDEAKEILKNSFFAKCGEYWYYNNGQIYYYKINKEFLPVQKGTNDVLLLPLSDTFYALGADKITMTKGNDLVISYLGESSRIMIDSYSIRNGFKVIWIKNPVSLYLNKSMASGEVYKVITGRSYLQDNDYIIILPLKTTVNNSIKKELFKSMDILYGNTKK
ncbi:glycerophosphodiester phosphodiesterase family protein [Anaerovorax odorimutans]|uniref:glycerophosphodiester phosphodiesterase family protein n=1 Tax=Anaerovorax odorimutans TaxID=109327 RepID=UPI001A99BB4F|nr:glycerophosphodiester phosphodiesterase family protein [Anaerovorax odorimutans]